VDKLNIDAPGFSEPTAGIVTGGQPDLALLTRLRNAGLRYVINLRPAAEDSSFDEAGAAKALGTGGFQSGQRGELQPAPE
jgi:hypothetical protein